MMIPTNYLRWHRKKVRSFDDPFELFSHTPPMLQQWWTYTESTVNYPPEPHRGQWRDVETVEEA